MSNGDMADARPGKRRLLRILGFVGLFILVGVLCGLLYWVTRPNRVVATAMFHVNRERPTILDVGASTDSTAEFEILKKSQMAAIKSEFVLQSALRKRGVASLSILSPHENPVEWLTANVRVGYPKDGEYLAIELEGTEEQSEDLQRLVDAIAKAYSDEVVFKHRQMELGNRDLRVSSLEKLNQEIRRKSEELSDIARETNQAGSLADDAMQEVLLRRLDRVEIEIMRLEDEQLRKSAGDETNQEFYEKRLAQLRERQSELEETIVRGRSPELIARQKEIRQLQQLADEMRFKVERLEIDANAPQRISQVQQAVVTSVSERALDNVLAP